MFTFSIVKRIGEGNYLGDDFFIIERVRKARALSPAYLKANGTKAKFGLSRGNGKSGHS